jgi:hypothetical protein
MFLPDEDRGIIVAEKHRLQKATTCSIDAAELPTPDCEWQPIAQENGRGSNAIPSAEAFGIARHVHQHYSPS